MCISFPGLVVALDADGAVVETEGRRRRASTDLVPDIATGDWVTVAAGTIVERLPAAEAAEIQRLVRIARTPPPRSPDDAVARARRPSKESSDVQPS